jgi:zinc transporter ZupT
LLRAAVARPLRAVAGALAIQAMTLVGFGLAGALAGFEGPRTMGAMLGLAGGAFLYLGVHALEGAWPRRSYRLSESVR